MKKDSIRSQLDGARNLFFGILKGLEGMINFPQPVHVYHYTSIENFRAIIDSETIRLYTVTNFDDNKERKLRFKVEDRIRAAFEQTMTGMNADFGQLVCTELSKDHVFVQSTSTDDSNQYLWNRYADGGKGLSIRLSPKRFVQHLNSLLPDFQIMSDYLKCCHIAYEPEAINQLLDNAAAAIQKCGVRLPHGSVIVWFFYVEFWRNFLKDPDHFKQENEYRLVVCDCYSLFLQVCGIIAKWRLFDSNDPEALSRAFIQEAKKNKAAVHAALRFEKSKDIGFVSIPLYEVLDGILIGPNCTLSKSDISELSKRKIRKSAISKSFPGEKRPNGQRQ